MPNSQKKGKSNVKKNKKIEEHKKGEYDNLDIDGLLNNSNRTLMENNVDDTNTTKNEEYHVCKGISKRFDALVDLCKELGNETSEKCIRVDLNDSFEEELLDQQQHINGESELNKITCEDSLPNHSNHILNDNVVNCGSKLWKGDEDGGNYCITQGIPKSIKFRSIDNIYKCTNRLSPIEAEYNWNRPTKEDSSIKTNKKNVGYKRKGRENKEKLDTATSST